MLSLIAVLLFLFGFWLDKTLNTSFFAFLPGLWILFFQPGYTLIEILFPYRSKTALENQKNKETKVTDNNPRVPRIERLFLAIPFSALFNTLMIYVAINYFHVVLNQEGILSTILGSTFLLGIIKVISQKQWHSFRPNPIRWSKSAIKHWPLLAGILTMAIVHAINFIIYPFIPEADSYFFINRMKEVISSGVISNISYRPFYEIFLLNYHYLTNANFLLFFKYISPIVLCSVLIPLYLFIRRFIKNPLHQYIALLIPLTSPLLVFELELTRPQSLIILTGFTTVWLLIRFIECAPDPTEKNLRTWKNSAIYLFSAFLVGLSSIGYHELGALNLTTWGATIIIFSIFRNRRKPILLFSLILAMYVLATYIINRISSLIFLQSIYEYFQKEFHIWPINWWYVSSYQNVDGIQVGWPGIQGLFFYGYNLGLFIPPLIIFAIVTYLQSILQRRKNKRPAEKQPILIPALSRLAIAALFAEILPRFGVYYLPERAWLFVISSLCFVLIPVVKQLLEKSWFSQKPNRYRALKVVITFTIIISIFVSFYLTYKRQGWINTKEHVASTWLKNNTPDDALIISQMGNMPMITVYANRQILSTENFFLDPELRQKTITSLESANQHIYLLYSKQKFAGLYGERAWWKEINQANADLNIINQDPKYKLIYEQNGIYIWEIRN